MTGEATPNSATLERAGTVEIVIIGQYLWEEPPSWGESFQFKLFKDGQTALDTLDQFDFDLWLIASQVQEPSAMTLCKDIL